MKFDNQIIEVLNNFSTINPSIAFRPGNIVTTMKPTRSVIGKAKTNIEFDSSFAFYSLGSFLGLLSNFEEPPELTVLDSHMIIDGGKANGDASFIFCDPSLIVVAPDKEIKMPEPDVEFDLDLATFKRVMKISATIGAPEIAIVGDGDKIYVKAMNTKNSGENSFRKEVGDTSKTFQLVFLVENLALLPRDYKVKISSKGLAYFEAEDIEYWIAVEQHSTFEG